MTNKRRSGTGLCIMFWQWEYMNKLPETETYNGMNIFFTNKAPSIHSHCVYLRPRRKYLESKVITSVNFLQVDSNSCWLYLLALYNRFSRDRKSRKEKLEEKQQTR